MKNDRLKDEQYHKKLDGGDTIGDRSVIGAGSVDVNDIPDDCFAAGNPARVIKILK